MHVLGSEQLEDRIVEHETKRHRLNLTTKAPGHCAVHMRRYEAASNQSGEPL